MDWIADHFPRPMTPTYMLLCLQKYLYCLLLSEHFKSPTTSSWLLMPGRTTSEDMGVRVLLLKSKPSVLARSVTARVGDVNVTKEEYIRLPGNGDGKQFPMSYQVSYHEHQTRTHQRSRPTVTYCRARAQCALLCMIGVLRALSARRHSLPTPFVRTSLVRPQED